MKALIVCCGILLVASASQAATAQSSPEFFPMPSMGGQSYPFSEAVRVGNTLYLAGQVGTAPGEGKVVPGGIAAESRQVMDNIKAVLERHGSSLSRVVKCTVFLADMKDWPAFNDVYRQYFNARLMASD